MSVATQVCWVCRQGGVTRWSLPRMAYRGSFPALAAEGDPLPRYAGRLPWRYDSLIEHTPITHVKARPCRTTGWPAQREALVSIRSIVFPWIGGSARSHTSIPGFVNRPASGASAALVTQPRIPILAASFRRGVQNGPQRIAVAACEFGGGFQARPGHDKTSMLVDPPTRRFRRVAPTVPPQRTFAEIAVPALTRQVAYRPCVPARHAGCRNRNGFVQLSLISAFSAL
jgi:hypothetical protein